MKMIMIIYNEAIDMEVMEMVDEAGVRSYTKFQDVDGKGTASGTHLGTDVWPGRNRVLFIAAPEANIHQLLAGVRSLRGPYGREGVKAFVLPIEEIT